MPEFRWTQPICGDCFAELEPGREPVRIKDRELEICVYCEQRTGEGIYTRIDPALAPHPTLTR